MPIKDAIQPIAKVIIKPIPTIKKIGFQILKMVLMTILIVLPKIRNPLVMVRLIVPAASCTFSVVPLAVNLFFLSQDNTSTHFNVLYKCENTSEEGEIELYFLYIPYSLLLL